MSTTNEFTDPLNGQPPRPDYLPDSPDMPDRLGDRWFTRLWAMTATLAVLLGVGFIVGGAEGRVQFFYSYLVGYMFALDIALGALFWVQMHHVAAATWSVGLRRIYENMTRAIPVLLFLFLPIAVGLLSDSLYHWSDAAANADDPLWQAKRPYLNAPFFLIRIGVYFAVWIALAAIQRNGSLRQDDNGDPLISQRLRGWAFPGTLLLALTSTFAAFDLMMSLNYHWFSTIFGVYFWVGGIRGSLSFAVLVVLILWWLGFLRNSITREHLHDAAKLMFGFTVFWAYIAFSQYFLIWYGNIPEETQWYVRRRVGDWYTLSVLLPIIYFVIPFFLLLPQGFKRTPWLVGCAAGWILACHFIDLYWQIMPERHPASFEELTALRQPGAMDSPEYQAYDLSLHWMTVVSALMMLGVLASTTLYGLWKYPMLPIRDPRIRESLAFENDTQV